MDQDLFELVDQTLHSRGPEAGFDLLVRLLGEQKKYPLVFEARLMRARHRMGLPLVKGRNISDLPPEQQPAYQAAIREAARETGSLFLADGDVVGAWPYFRAIGDPGPVADAIERLSPNDATEPVIQIALNERVNPRKGFALLLHKHGICTAMSCAARYPDRADRVEFLRQLVRAISRELVAALQEAIASVEGQIPATQSVAELIAGRDWLFTGARYYTENSHLTSMVEASVELEDRETLRLAWELAEYGRHLDPVHHLASQPPFADTYVDFGAYLSALLGQNVDTSVAHFRKKLDDSVPGSAEILVGLLTRLGRYTEALDISVECLGGEAGSTCPSAIQLCQMASDYRRLSKLARQEGDLLAFAAGLLQQQSVTKPHL
jgi:hypothetical protein